MAVSKSSKRGKSPKAKSKQESKAKPAARRKVPARAKKAVPKRAVPKKAVPKKAVPKKAVPKLAWPRVSLPELPEIEGYVRSLPPPIVPIVNRLRQLVRDAAPEARELLDPNGPAYDSNGLFARIEAGDRQVMLTFLKGAQLDADEGTLLGDGATRVLTVDSLEGLKESVLQALVRQAVLLNVRDPASGAV